MFCVGWDGGRDREVDGCTDRQIYRWMGSKDQPWIWRHRVTLPKAVNVSNYV